VAFPLRRPGASPTMKRLLLPLLLCSALAHGAPFYDGKSLAHPAIGASQDSGLDIAFLKEKTA